MAFSPPPTAPQRGDRTTFSGRVDAFLLWLVALIPQLNTFLASLTTMAAGGANAFAYAFDTSTGDADPGNGRLRLNSGVQNTASILRLDSLAGNGGDVTGFLTALQTGTSNVKSAVRLQKVGDPSAYLLFDITSVTAATGYLNLAVIPRASSTSSPFAANDTVVVFFDPKGDRGDSGSLPTDAQIRAALGTLPISSGGTGQTTAANARTALDVPSNAQAVRIGVANDSAATRLRSGLAPDIAGISAAGQAENVPLIISNAANNGASAVVLFSRDGSFGAFFGLDTDNKWKVGGLSMGSVSYEIFHTGNYNPANYAQLTGAAFTGGISAPKVTQTSDERKKTNWRALTDVQLDALADLEQVGLFDWIDGSGTSIGGPAQQIRAIVPEAVHEDADGNLSVNYGGLCFAMAHGALRRSRGRAKGSW